MTVDSGALAERFGELFGRMPTLVAKAPGRVNIIGEHTDYSEGFVMPCAIDRGVAVAFAPEPDGKIVVYSEYADETAHGGAWPTPVGWVRIDLADPGAALDALPVGHWGRYVAGVAASLVEERLPVGGFSGVIESDLPVGAGLSSSAAVELAVAVALVASGQSNAAAIAGALADPSFRRSLALACQRAEHQAVGVKCGIMDQMAVALGRAGHALFLDCRTLDYEHVPLPPDTCLVVYNTGVSRHLAGSNTTCAARRWRGGKPAGGVLGAGGWCSRHTHAARRDRGRPGPRGYGRCLEPGPPPSRASRGGRERAHPPRRGRAEGMRRYGGHHSRCPHVGVP